MDPEDFGALLVLIGLIILPITVGSWIGSHHAGWIVVALELIVIGGLACRNA